MERLLKGTGALVALAVLDVLLLVVALACYAPQAQAAVNGHPVVVSMGDSYSSGEGNPPYYGQDSGNKYQNADWLAHRSKIAWPSQLIVDGVVLGSIKDNGWSFVAASSATSDDYTGRQLKEWKESIFSKGSKTLDPQIDAVKNAARNGTVDYVTMTIGGNDLGFSDIAKSGISIAGVKLGSVENEIASAIDKFSKKDGVRAKLLQMYRDVAEAAGDDAYVLVVGYPHLLPAGGRTWYPAESARTINQAVDVFCAGVSNGIRKEIASDHIRFVDVRTEFNGYEADYIYNAEIFSGEEQLLFDDPINPRSMHPNAQGQAAYTRAVQDEINAIEKEKASASAAVASESAAVVSPEGEEVAMSLVFDVSGSMDEPSAYGSATKLGSAKQQSRDFVETMRTQIADGLDAQLGVASFATYAQEDCPLTKDCDAVLASIDRLGADGLTDMYEGLRVGIEQLEGANGHKIIVYLSDGLDTSGNSQASILGLAQQAADAGVKVYTIGFGSSRDLDEALLQQIADITGGAYSHEDSTTNLASAAVGLFGAMMNARLSATGQLLIDGTGTVGQGETVPVGTFEVSQGGTMQAYLYWPGSMLDLLLTDPEGVLVDSTYPGLTIDTSTIPISVTVTGAKPGTWQMEVFGREVSMPEEPYYAVVALTAEQLAAAAGGGSAGNSTGYLLVLVVIAAACVTGVYAYSKRRTADGERRSSHD